MNLPVAFYTTFAALFGFAIGSFLNVVIHRVPIGKSVVFPGSHCPRCGAGVRPFDNVPLLSYLLLGGKCRDCGDRISFVYPLVELLTALMFVVLLIKNGPNWETALLFIFTSAIIALIFIDAQHQLLPNIITYPLFVFALVATAFRAGWGSQDGTSFQFFLIIPAFQQEFSAGRAALIGGFIIALAAPGFRLIDWLDSLLFDRYLELEELDEQPDAAEIEHELVIERRSIRVIYATIIMGVLLAAAWIVMFIGFSKQQPLNYEGAYSGLWHASWGALIGGGAIWWLRTLYFFVRRMEGVGLGDVKMMAGIGAVLGGTGAL